MCAGKGLSGATDQCPICEAYDTDVDIHGPAQLRRVIDKIRAGVRNGRLLADDALSRHDIGDQANFMGLDLSETLPDVLNYCFHCTACTRQFMLQCETYHGSGGKWRRISG